MSTDERFTAPAFLDPQICNRCRRQPFMVRSFLDSSTGQVVQMFECECGERNWRETSVGSNPRTR
jgi:hypothetical protein